MKPCMKYKTDESACYPQIKDNEFAICAIFLKFTHVPDYEN